MKPNPEDLPSKKEIAYIAAGVSVLVGSWVAYMSFVYDPHGGSGANRSSNPLERIDPYKQAKIISESSGPGKKDPSLLLRQRLPDGRVITARKPVFIGEVAIREPGEKVIPAELEAPLPEQP